MPEISIKRASTVVLCQKMGIWPNKTLLIQRSLDAKFLPGAHVFPGGQVDSSDHSKHLFDQDKALYSRMASYFPSDKGLLAAHIAAAIREMKEEAGVSIKPHDLWPLSWWVTPAGETRRFDTWFFLAAASSETLECRAKESAEVLNSLWIEPAEALRLYEAGEIFLPPPTRSVLERMAMTNSFEHLLSLVDQPLKAIHPLFIEEDGQKVLILPGHERHPDARKSSFTLRTAYKFP